MTTVDTSYCGEDCAYAVDVYSGDDWGVPVHTIGYVLKNYEDACEYATTCLATLWERGETRIGATVISEDRAGDSDDPLIEVDITPTTLGWTEPAT